MFLYIFSMIQTLLLLELLLILALTSSCPANYQLQNLQAGNVLFTISSNNNQIATQTFHYYLTNVFTSVPTIALSIQTIKINQPTITEWAIKTKNITNRQFSVDFIHYPLQWSMIKAGFWASSRQDIIVGQVTSILGSLKQAVASVFVNLTTTLPNPSASILRAFLTGYTQKSGSQTGINVFSRSLTANSAQLGIQVANEMQVSLAQISYIIFNPITLPFASYGGGVSEFNLTQPKLYNIQKLIHFSQHKFYGIASLQQNNSTQIQLSIDIDDEFYMQLLPSSQIQSIRISYLIVGVLPIQACSNCKGSTFVFQSDCVSNCETGSYVVNYQNGINGCRTCPDKYNLVINDANNACTCKRGFIEQQGYCVPDLIQNLNAYPMQSIDIGMQNINNDNTSSVDYSIVQTKITTLHPNQINNTQIQNQQQPQDQTTQPLGLPEIVPNIRSNSQNYTQYTSDTSNINNYNGNTIYNNNIPSYTNNMNSNVAVNNTDIYGNLPPYLPQQQQQYQYQGIPQDNTNIANNNYSPYPDSSSQYIIPNIPTTKIPNYSFGATYLNSNPKTCQIGQILNPNTNKCQCIFGYGLYGTSCQICTTITRGFLLNGQCNICPNNGIYINGSCTCEIGMSFISGMCVSLNCSMNQEISFGQCICKNGYQRIYGICVIQCPKNTVQIQGQCGTCPDHSIYNQNEKSCTCQTGYSLNLEGLCIISNELGFPVSLPSQSPLIVTPTTDLSIPQQCKLCIDQTYINQNNVYVMLSTPTQISFVSLSEMRSFIKYSFPDPSTFPTSAFCNQNSDNFKIFECLLIYAAGVPSKIFYVNFSYNYQNLSGFVTATIDPLTSLIQTRSLT